MRVILLIFLCLASFLGLDSFAQTQVSDELLNEMDDDLNIGGDIFNDYQEDVESAQILEDERFYRYGRFFSVNLGIGHTTFSGNRGAAYKDKIPSFHLSVVYFMNFTSAFNFGLEFSKHEMFIDFPTIRYPNRPSTASPEDILGAIDISILRPFLAYRFYFDTSNLNSIFSYSNPYFTARMEYWYQTNTFTDDSSIDTEKGGGIGAGLGFGLEFPLEIKKRYLGVEALIHPVDYYDADVTGWGPAPGETVGFDDLKGLGYSLKLSLNLTW